MMGTYDVVRRSRRSLLLALTLTGLAWTTADAQTTTARITGTVTGDNAAPVADATVTARSITTNLTRSARTAANGFYALTGLTPDEYEIIARRIGLQPQTKRIRVYVGQSIGVDFNLPTQAVQLSGVQISAEATSEQTERRSTEVATNITAEQMEAIPLTERNFLSLAMLAPGVRRDGGSISSGAQSANNINVFVDGVSFKSDILTGGLVGQDASKGNPFPQNAVQEFRVITQQYKAEYQKATSAIITATTKSGTNVWQGNAFGLFQNENAIQRDFITQFKCDSAKKVGGPCADKPRLDKYQIGGDLGGPIIKDKLFFFGSYEGNLQTRAATVNLGNNTATLPQKTLDSLKTFTGTFESPFRGQLGFGKLTYAPSERHRFELSANMRDEYDIRNFGGTNSYDNAEWFFNDVYTYLLKHQYTRGNALNEASVSFQRFHWNPIPLYESKVGVLYSNVLKVGGRSTRQDFNQKRLSFRDDITYSKSGWFGDHVFKVGTNIDHVIYDIIRPLNGVPQFTFDATNNWAFPTTAVAGFGNPDLSADNQQLGVFAQDDWSLTPKLTLNLGIRWDYESDMMNNDWVTPDSIRTQVNAWRATLACDGTQRVREQLCDPSPYLTDGDDRKPFYRAFQPRIGLSYDVFGSGKTVLHGGYGLYYDRNRYGNALSEMGNLRWVSYTFRFSQSGGTVGGNPTIAWNPSYFSREGLQGILATGAAPRPELFLTKNSTEPPKAHQMSFGVRQALGPLFGSLSYTAVRGYNTFQWIRANRNANGSCCAAFPTAANNRYSNVFVSSDDSRNWYDAVYVMLEKRFTGQNKWGAQIAYTYGKAEEESSAGDVFTALNVLTVDDFIRYPTSSDERHRVTGNWIVALPLGLKFSGILDLGSGNPYNATVGFGAGTNNCTHGNMDCLNGNDYPPGKTRNWFRPDGDSFLGLDMWAYRNIDFRLEKTFRTLRGQRIGVTGELFNVFNFRNWSGYNTGYGNFAADGSITRLPAFGTPTAVITDLTRGGSPRRFQLGLNYSFDLTR